MNQIHRHTWVNGKCSLCRALEQECEEKPAGDAQVANVVDRLRGDVSRSIDQLTMAVYIVAGAIVVAALLLSSR